MLKIALTAVVSAALLVAVAACGKSTIDQSSEVDLVNKVVTAKGGKTKSVDCPSDVEAKEGTSFSCTAALTSGQNITVDIKVQSVSGSHAQLQATGLHVNKGS